MTLRPLVQQATERWRRAAPLLRQHRARLTVAGVACVALLAVIWGSGSGPTQGEAGHGPVPVGDQRQLDAWASSITAVLQQDEKIWQKLDQLVAEGTSVVDAIRQGAQEARRLNLSGCPEDFRVAYSYHISEWEALELELSFLPESALGQVWAGFVNTLSGELDGGTRRITESLKRRAEAVYARRAEMLAIAARYGASLAEK